MSSKRRRNLWNTLAWVLLLPNCLALPPSAFFDLTKGTHPTCQAGNSTGICVFSLTCFFGGGTPLGICRDRFYFGTCCKVKDAKDGKDVQLKPVAEKPVFEAIEAEIVDNTINNEVCGLRSPVAHSSANLFRIVGGNSSAFGMWPWQASLMVIYLGKNNVRQRCGAVVIGEKWVLTAAHCVKGFDPSDLMVRFGDFNRVAASEPEAHVDRDVYEIFVHPDYDSVSYEFDIAIIYFDEKIGFSRHIRPICLPEPGDESVVIRGKAGMGYVTGWGTLYEGGPKPEVLYEAQVPVFDHRVCNDIFNLAGLDEKLTDTFICAGVKEGGTDACEGDSGGPLVMENPRTRRWILSGIVSWGNGCGEKYQPGVYTNVAKLAGWIYDIVGAEREVRAIMV